MKNNSVKNIIEKSMKTSGRGHLGLPPRAYNPAV